MGNKVYVPARQVPRSRIAAEPVRLPCAEHEIARRSQIAAPRPPEPQLNQTAGRRYPQPRRSATLPDWTERNLFRLVTLILLVGTPVLSVLLVLLPFNINSTAGHPGGATLASASGAPDLHVGAQRADGASGSPYRVAESVVDKAAAKPENSEAPASIVAREWSLFERTPVVERQADRPRLASAEDGAAAFTAAAPVPVVSPARATRLAAISPAAVTGRRADTEAKTTLVDFETAPFPYDGDVPGSNKPFLNVGEVGHRGHVNFRGHVLWESETFADSHVLLHIPPGFDARRPAVMVVYFHGHGADLARDVRDRQEVPAQITAAGMNAVLVAPQFAFDAADSSAGKFWERNGFKRFLDEAAVKLALLYGDPRSIKTFADMPIVIVAYSGGFGPTLSVLDRGGVQSRIRGLVLLDALYAGIDKFADWISNNRSAFFVSSYTPHTAHHNADLERQLSARSVPYVSELRPNHLQGMVAFLPTGNISHRNFVNRAWTEDPITDILVRLDDLAPNNQTAHVASAFSGRD